MGTTKGGYSAYTTPHIDTSINLNAGGSGLTLFDYDGVEPLEYINLNGKVYQCRGDALPTNMPRIDTITCWPPTIAPDFSADVDGDGYLDVVCDIGGGGKAFKVISGGPQAGKGCERVTSFDVPSPGSEINWIDALYRSVNGQWRMIHNTTDKSNEYLILHEVRFTRTSPRGDGLHASFTALDTIFTLPGDIGRPSTIGSLVVVQDTILKRDYMVLKYKPGFTQWVTERFDVTDGQFVASGDRVAGLEMLSSSAVTFSLGHLLQTTYPVFASSTADDGELFFSVYDLVHPIAVWNAQGSGVQPVAGHAIINDQTGDGQPDLVWSGGNPASLILLTLDTSIVSVREQEAPQTDVRAHMSGMTLTVQTTQPCSITVDIAAIDGRTLYSAPPTTLDTGEYRQDLSSVLQQLVSGAYFVRVRCGAQLATIPIMHVHQ
jgi:hypothetical protein